MLKKIFFCLVMLCLANPQTMKACYSIASVTETVTQPSSSSPLSTLSVCHQYRFTYEIRNGSSSVVNDNITINLPNGISYASLVSSTGASVSYASGSTSPVFAVTGWGAGATMTITILANTPACDAVATPNNYTTINGANACAGSSVSSSLLIVPPTLSAINNAGTGSLLVNVGDVNELVFKLDNVSSNGADIPQVNIACSPDATISFLGRYYISTTGTGLSGNIYTYSDPAVTALVTTPTIALSTNTIVLAGTDFHYFYTGTAMPPAGTLYVHIPYEVRNCGTPGGTYTISTGCGATPCSSVQVNSSIGVQTGSPSMTVSGYPAFNNATFCASSGQPTSGRIGFVYLNNGHPATGAPAGGGRATNLQLFLYNTTASGTLDYTTIQLSSGTHTITVPTSLVSPSTSGSFTTYTVDLSALAVPGGPMPGNAWQPLGNNTIADLDGDGFVDDLAENDSFTITANYTYNTASCPDFGSPGYTGIVCNILSKYNNECLSLTPADPRQSPMSTADADSRYYYATGSGGATLTVPPDVLEGASSHPFDAAICTNTFYEKFSPPGYDLNCPAGYHQVNLTIPSGYHLNPAGLTLISPGTSGVSGSLYQMPSITAVGLCGGSQALLPTVQEFCKQGSVPAYILVKFGRIGSSSCLGDHNETYNLPCFNVPMYLDCAGSTAACASVPANFGQDQLSYQFQFICDASCITCASGIASASTVSYHHCDGLCDSYFSTEQNFTFQRKTLGSSNANPYYSCAGAQTALSVSTEPTIDLHSAYPGDVIETTLSGSFSGTHSLVPVFTGTSFSDIYLQIRFNSLPAGTSASPDLFNLDPLHGSVTIINQTTLASTVIAASDLTYNFSTAGSISQMNISLPAGGRAWMSSATTTYSLVADLFLVAKSTPVLTTNSLFYTDYPTGKHPLTDLRAEFMGTETGGNIDNSCDSWGAHFSMLQPRVAIDKFYSVDQGSRSTCSTYTLGVAFGVYGGKYYEYMDDFPNEFRPYAALDPAVQVKLPAGYQYLSSSFTIMDDIYSSTATNGFGIYTHQNFPITGEVATGSPALGTTINYNGLNPATGCWPLLDVKYGSQYPIYHIDVVMQPLCTALPNDHVEWSSGYTEGINQANPAYQRHTSFTYTNIPIRHANPSLTMNAPAATTNAYGNLVTFDFTFCDDATADANHPWMAFENSALNSLDLGTATITAFPAGMPSAILSHTVYTDGSGHPAVIAGTPPISALVCENFRIEAYVNANGCVPTGSAPQLDHMTVRSGNECSGSVITSPDGLCEGTPVLFPFEEYPSNLQLLVPPGGLPTNPVSLCNGIQTYSLLISSSDIGTVKNPDFWIHLPAGITVTNIQFDYAIGSPASFTTGTPDAFTFGGGGDPGWHLSGHFPVIAANGLPDANLPVGSTANQVAVTVTLQTSCGYNSTDYVKFFAGGLSSCSQNITTAPVQQRPAIINSSPADNLDVQVSFSTSDMAPGLNCSNTGVVTVTVTNNGSTANLHDDVITVVVPGATVLSHTGSALVTGHSLAWTIHPTFLAGSGATQTFSFNISLNNTLYCASGLPITAGISYSETVACTPSGSCAASYSSNPVSVAISACCQCALTVSITPHSVSCYGLSDGSATASPSNGTSPYSYAWSDAYGQTVATATSLPAGSYTVTVTDANGCTATQTTSISQPAPVVITLSPSTSTICAGGSQMLCASGATTYSWSTAATGSCVTVSPSVTTVYTATGTTGGCKSAPVSATVNVNASPMLCMSASQTVCVGDGCPKVSGACDPLQTGLTYSWTPSASVSFTSAVTTTVCPTATTIYTLTAANAAGCISTGTTQVTVLTAPVVSVSPATATICAGNTQMLCGSGATTYSWSTAATSSCITVAPTATMTTYTVYAHNGKCIASATATVYARPGPSLCVTPSATICSGSCGILENTCGGKLSYTWTPSAGLPSPNSASTTACPTVTTTYTLTASTPAGCTGTLTTTIFVTPTPTPVISPATSTICAGSSQTLCASGAATYSWSTAATSTCITVTPTATITTYTVTGFNGNCSASATATVYTSPLPQLCISSSTAICAGSCYTMNGLCDGAPMGTTYTWSPTTTSPHTATTVACPTVTTVYTLTVGSPAGCTSSITTTISIIPTPTISISPQTSTICAGSSRTLCATGASSYTWSTGSHSTCIVVSPTATTVYTVTGSNGCTPVSITATVVVTPSPTVVISPSTPTICAGATQTLCASGATSYTWSTTATSTCISVSPGSTTVYTVTGASNGCTGTATATITVNQRFGLCMTSSVAVCPGACRQITGSCHTSTAGVSFNWTPATGVTAPSAITTSVCPASSTIYTLTATTSSGCVSTGTVSVVVPPASLSVSGPTFVTCGTYSLYTVSPVITVPPTTYSWSATHATPASGTGTSASISFSYPGGVITWTATTTIDSTTVCRVTKTLTVSCLPSGGGGGGIRSLGNETGNVSAAIHPNPNNGNMLLDYEIGDDGVLEIMDAASKIVARYPVLARDHVLEIHHDQLENGVYVYRLLIKGIVIKADKIVIIK